MIIIIEIDDGQNIIGVTTYEDTIVRDEKFEKTIDSKLINTFEVPKIEFATA